MQDRGTHGEDGASTAGYGSQFNELVEELRKDVESDGKGGTALLDGQLRGFDVPDPRILIVGCGGSGNNTLNRITHLGVEGAVTVAINTDKQHLDHTRALQKLLVGKHITRGLGIDLVGEGEFKPIGLGLHLEHLKRHLARPVYAVERETFAAAGAPTTV